MNSLMLNLINTLDYLPKWFFVVYIALFGLCCGSFLNVVILRGLSGENFFLGRSHCPKCLNNLKWYMNIPLFSYLFLRGRCAFCKEKISLQYPIIEALCAILFVFSYLKLGFNFIFLFSMIFIFMSLALFVTDLKEKVIIDYHAYSLALFGFLYSIFTNSEITFLQSIVGAIFGYLILEIVSRLSVKIFSQRAFGEGDSLITLAYGAVLGAPKLILLILLAIFIQVLSCLPVLLIGALKKKKIKLAIAYIMVIFSILALFINKFFNLIQDENYYLIFVLFVSIFLIWALIQVVKDIREKKELFDSLNIEDEYDEKNPYNLFAFGPSLVISFFIIFYFYNELINLVKSFLL